MPNSYLINCLIEKLVEVFSVDKTLYFACTFFEIKRKINSNIRFEWLGTDRSQRNKIMHGAGRYSDGVLGGRVDINLSGIAESLNALSNGSIGIYEFQEGTNVFLNNDLVKALEEQNCFINANLTMFDGTNLVLISKTKTDLYFAKFSEETPQEIQINLILKQIVFQLDPTNWQDGSATHYEDDPDLISLLTQEELDIGGVISNPHYGMRVDAADYKGLDEWKIKKEVSNLKAKIGKYELIPLKELAIEINFAKLKPTTSEQPVSSKVHEPITVTERQPKNDQIYIPLLEKPRLEILGPYKADVEPKNIRIDAEFLCEVIVDQRKILPDYLCNFLNSDLGVRIKKLAHMKQSDAIELNKSEVEQIEIAVPPLTIQLEIVKTAKIVRSSIQSLQDIELDLSINPIASQEDLDKLDRVQLAIGELSASDRLKSLVRQDESIKLEFKSSLRTPYPDYPPKKFDEKGQQFYLLPGEKEPFKSQKQIHAHLEKASLKTIVAFLNTKGGSLIIGITDDKFPVGIEREYVGTIKSNDDYLKHLTQIIENRIGLDLPIEPEIIELDGKKICLISVSPFLPKQGQLPIHLDQEIIYQRSGPKTNILKGKALTTFIVERATISK